MAKLEDSTSVNGTSHCLATDGPRGGAAFQSTLWSQVRAAGGSHAAKAKQALENLCRIYWNPIYWFLRRSGHDRPQAEDLTQGFFLYILEGDLLQKADEERGRFRSFLLGALKFFVANQQTRARSVKRGGRATFVPIGPRANEHVELLTQLTPERVFEKKWAVAVIGEAIERLEKEYRRAGLAGEFACLQPYLTGEPEDHLSDLARRLVKSHSAARVMMFRMRNRFRATIRAVIADTVSDPGQVEHELAELRSALRAH